MDEDLIKKDEDNKTIFNYYFKLDTHELLGDEEITFELLNYKQKEPIEFYLCAKSLKKNTSRMMIEFPKDKQKEFKEIKKK
jgi:hypothetical protein